MSFEITIHTPASSTAVLRALRDDLRECIPTEARRPGVLRVHGSVQRDTFRMWARRPARSFAAPVMRGKILTTPTGGSTIVARCTPDSRVLLPIVLIGIILVWNVFAGPDMTGIVTTLFMAAFYGGIYLVQRSIVSIDLAEARILTERLRGVVARLDSANHD